VTRRISELAIQRIIELAKLVVNLRDSTHQ
jgi:hypothetical protein